MTLRRLPAAAILALLVAVLAHVAGVGFDHAPGSAHAAALLGTLGVSLFFALAAAFCGGALRGRGPSIATTAASGYSALGLAAGGFAGYALIELFEGHLTLGGALRALVAVVPVALGVAFAARTIAAAAQRAGARFAGFVRVRGRRAAPRHPAHGRSRLRAVSAFARRASRGRAPPALA